MKKFDCMGDMCPIPVLKIKSSLDAIRAGQTVMVVTDHSCAKENVADFCKLSQLHCSVIEVMSGVWEITISSI